MIGDDQEKLFVSLTSIAVRYGVYRLREPSAGRLRPRAAPMRAYSLRFREQVAGRRVGRHWLCCHMNGIAVMPMERTEDLEPISLERNSGKGYTMLALNETAHQMHLDGKARPYLATDFSHSLDPNRTFRGCVGNDPL